MQHATPFQIEPLEARCLLNGAITLLKDDFSGSSLNLSLWHQPSWNPDGSTYLGRTQLQVLGSSPSPTVGSGSLLANLQTYNPTQLPGEPSFWGTEIISNQTFTITPGKTLEFQYRAKMNMTTGGGVLGLFLYGLNRRGMDNEIDTEIETTHVADGANTVETNVYANQPLGTGSPAAFPLPRGAKLTGWHTYEIALNGGIARHGTTVVPPSVSWFADGKLIRSETTLIPTHAMNVYVNFWAPDQGWADAYNPNIQATTVAAQNQTWTADVDSITVTSLTDSPRAAVTNIVKPRTPATLITLSSLLGG